MGKHHKRRDGGNSSAPVETKTTTQPQQKNQQPSSTSSPKEEKRTEGKRGWKGGLMWVLGTLGIITLIRLITRGLKKEVIYLNNPLPATENMLTETGKMLKDSSLLNPPDEIKNLVRNPNNLVRMLTIDNVKNNFFEFGKVPTQCQLHLFQQRLTLPQQTEKYYLKVSAINERINSYTTWTGITSQFASKIKEFVSISHTDEEVLLPTEIDGMKQLIPLPQETLIALAQVGNCKNNLEIVNKINSGAINPMDFCKVPNLTRNEAEKAVLASCHYIPFKMAEHEFGINFEAAHNLLSTLSELVVKNKKDEVIYSCDTIMYHPETCVVGEYYYYKRFMPKTDDCNEIGIVTD